MGIIQAVAAHRLAPNLLMLMMFAAGLLVAGKMETRFFPAFETQTIRVTAGWRGAAAEDVGDALLTPMENELRDLSDLEEMSSTARDGSGSINLTFPEGTDLQKATNDVRRRLGLIEGKLPADADKPKVQAVARHDSVMNLALSGRNLAELRRLARRLETQLLALGVVRAEVAGLPKEEIQILLTTKRLTELGLTPADVGRQLAQQNIDITAGDIGGDDNARLLRATSKHSDIAHFADMPLVAGGDILRLGDIADIVRRPQKNTEEIFFDGKPAVEFRLTSKSGGNILDAAAAVRQWADKTRPLLPAGMELTAYGERWKAVESRLNLLLENGLQGLALVLLFLLLFLRTRLALWVAAGIPATYMVALAALYVSGGSINMISMFAFIMVTGIIVDDAIVVGENGMHHLRQGKPPFAAAVDGAKEMFVAVFSSTFTTIASFMPLLFVGGGIGAIIFTIPLVVICALLASLFECFLVLPGHMRSAFTAIAAAPENRWRQRLDDAFHRFQEGPFRRSAQLALRHRWVVVTAAFTILTLSLALLAGGFLKYRFFPGAELNRVRAEVVFIAGAQRHGLEQFMQDINTSARRAAAQFPEETNLLQHVAVYLKSDNNAEMLIELSQPEERDIGTADFVRAWRRFLPQHAELEKLNLRESRGGPSGEDLQIRLSGADNDALKTAALQLRTAMSDLPGVSRPSDDMPYGRRQTVFELNSRGRALNLTVDDIARQLRNTFDGYPVQTLYDGLDETNVRVFADADGEDLSVFRVRLKNGEQAALSDVADLRERRGFDVVRRVDARPVVNVVGNIDYDQTSLETVVQQLEADILPAVAAQHGVTYSFEGSRAREQETVSDMKAGLVAALLFIFVILAAVFSSWTLPLAVLLTVPFGIIGAMLGHWLLGYDMSILSAFGVFTLNGIIVNDSIILVRDYLERRKQEPDANEDSLLVDAACRRLRAILLTSLTTVGGLIPLLFETSIQAQFLIPMAVSISFGLMFATLLILYLMPAYVSIHNSCARRLAAVMALIRPPPPHAPQSDGGRR